MLFLSARIYFLLFLPIQILPYQGFIASEKHGILD